MNISSIEACATRTKSPGFKTTKGRTHNKDTSDLRRHVSKLASLSLGKNCEKTRGNPLETVASIERSYTDPEIMRTNRKLENHSSHGKDKKARKNSKKTSHKGKSDVSKMEKKKDKPVTSKEYINFTTKGEASGNDDHDEIMENIQVPVSETIEQEEIASAFSEKEEKGVKDIGEERGRSAEPIRDGTDDEAQQQETKQHSNVLPNKEKTFTQAETTINKYNMKEQDVEPETWKSESARHIEEAKANIKIGKESPNANCLMLPEFGEGYDKEKIDGLYFSHESSDKYLISDEKHRKKHHEKHANHEKRASTSSAKLALALRNSSEQSPSTPRRRAAHSSIHEQFFDLSHSSPRLIHEILEGRDRPLYKRQISSPAGHRRSFGDASTNLSLPSSPELQLKRRSLPAAIFDEFTSKGSNSSSASNSPPQTGFHYPIGLDSGHRTIYTDLPTMPRHLARRALKRMGFKEEAEEDGKSLSEKFEELKACRYLRVPKDDQKSKDSGNHMKI